METMFSDEVVLATDLKRNQRYWFDRARKTGGVTIMQGKLADLALVPRQMIAEKTEATIRSRMASQFFSEIIALDRSPSESVVFPWLKDLDEEEQSEFCREFAGTFAKCLATGQWTDFDQLLEDWQATAEARRNPDLLEAWRTRGHPEDYVPVESLDAG